MSIGSGIDAEVGQSLGDVGAHDLRLDLERGLEQIGLVAEVVLDEGDRDPGSARHLAKTDVAEAALGGDVADHSSDLAAAFVVVDDSWHLRLRSL